MGITLTREKPVPNAAVPGIPEAYKSWIVNDCCKYMDFDGLQDAGKAVRAM